MRLFFSVLLVSAAFFYFFSVVFKRKAARLKQTFLQVNTLFHISSEIEDTGGSVNCAEYQTKKSMMLGMCKRINDENKVLHRVLN